VTVGAGKPWWVSGSVRFGYDSNVVIEPDGSGALLAAQGISHRDAGFTAITAGAGYTLLDTSFMSLLGEYDFYQSIFFDLDQFDLQGHRLQLSAISKPGKITYGILGAYDFYLLDFQTFYQQGTATPWVAFEESDWAATRLHYSARAQDFFRGPYDPGRDSIDNAIGARQFFTLGNPDRLLSIGYQWDFLDTFNNGPPGRDFQYMGNLFDIGVSTPLWSLATMQVGYLLYLEDYQYPNSRADFIFRRHDAEQQVALTLLRDLTPHIAVTGDFIAVINHSNIDAFEYNRYIFAVGVRVLL